MLLVSLNDGKFSEARKYAGYLSENLDPSIDGIVSEIIGRMKRGLEVGDYWRRIVSIVYDNYVRRIYNRVSQDYITLNAGNYAIVANKPSGLYDLPGSIIEQDLLLAKLGLGVRVSEVTDIDVVFTNVLREQKREEFGLHRD